MGVLGLGLVGVVDFWDKRVPEIGKKSMGGQPTLDLHLSSKSYLKSICRVTNVPNKKGCMPNR